MTASCLVLSYLCFKQDSMMTGLKVPGRFFLKIKIVTLYLASERFHIWSPVEFAESAELAEVQLSCTNKC